MNPARQAGGGMRAWRHFAAWLVLAVVLSQVLALGGVYSWSWVPAQLCLLAGLVAVLAASAWHRAPLPWSPILVPVGLFGLLVAAQWAFHWSAYPALTLTGLLQLSAGGAALCLVLFAFRSEANVRRMSAVLWVFTGALAAEAIAQYFQADKRIYWFRDASYATPVGPFVYHNHYAGLLDLLFPVCLAVTFRPLGRPRPDLLGIIRRALVPALVLVSLVISYSRGGFFALLFESGLALVLYSREIRASRQARRHIAWLALAMVGFTALGSWRPLLNRLINLEYHDASAYERLAVAASCVRIWRDHPWVGTGFATFPAVYPAYQTFDSDWPWEEAHNEYAQTLAETGLAGAGLVLVFLGLVLRALWRQRRKHSQHSSELFRSACLIGIAGFLFHAYGDFVFHAPADMLMFFLLIGVTFTMPTPSRRRSSAQAESGVSAGDNRQQPWAGVPAAAVTSVKFSM